MDNYIWQFPTGVGFTLVKMLDVKNSDQKTQA